MARELEGGLDGRGLRIGIVVSRFNEFITSRLLQGAQDALERHGVRDAETAVVWVPGALELPQAAKPMATSGRWDALIALGAVIRGETAHFDLVAHGASQGIARVAHDTGVPVAFGVLATDTVEQATARAGGKLGNRGADAAETAVHMANLVRQLAAEPAASAQEASS